ncbi:reverse transcriptase family protein [Caenimonas koreensis]|uniref:reverse transcriptase family protein n=1 Tax=Caenimonas koreensis TaxID=367474 RepID=UPI003783F0E2
MCPNGSLPSPGWESFSNLCSSTSSNRVGACFFMRPIYNAQPIGSIDSLALALGVSRSALTALATAASSHYSTFTIPKKKELGQVREVCGPSHELKVVQKRINRMIFEKVTYPAYLFGGVPDTDYFKNAAAHSNARSLIALDVRNFYGNISTKEVLKIFKFFCKFPTDVAQILAQLTTKDGWVPQGACTSSHLANLVFFDTEHRVIREMQQQGLRYSRLLDDITISSKNSISPNLTGKIVEKIKVMLADKGMKLKTKKTRISSSSNPETLMEVTGLWLNRGIPKVFRSERHEIRAQLFRLEQLHKVSCTDPSFHDEHNRLSGRVSKVAYVGHFEAEDFRRRLHKILPKYDAIEVARTVRLVKTICVTPPHLRNSLSYIDKYHKVLYRLGIVGRTNKALSTSQRALVLKCAPSMSKEDVLYG